VYLVRVFLASYWSAWFGTFHQVSALASHLLEDCANLRQRPLLMQAASQSTFIPLRKGSKSDERTEKFSFSGSVKTLNFVEKI
jgi:hypothetical protein